MNERTASVLRVLRATPGVQMTTGEIACELDVTPKSICTSLRVLAGKGYCRTALLTPGRRCWWVIAPEVTRPILPIELPLTYRILAVLVEGGAMTSAQMARHLSESDRSQLSPMLSYLRKRGRVTVTQLRGRGARYLYRVAS